MSRREGVPNEDELVRTRANKLWSSVEQIEALYEELDEELRESSEGRMVRAGIAGTRMTLRQVMEGTNAHVKGREVEVLDVCERMLRTDDRVVRKLLDQKSN